MISPRRISCRVADRRRHPSTSPDHREKARRASRHARPGVATSVQCREGWRLLVRDPQRGVPAISASRERRFRPRVQGAKEAFLHFLGFRHSRVSPLSESSPGDRGGFRIPAVSATRRLGVVRGFSGRRRGFRIPAISATRRLGVVRGFSGRQRGFGIPAISATRGLGVVRGFSGRQRGFGIPAISAARGLGVVRGFSGRQRGFRIPAISAARGLGVCAGSAGGRGVSAFPQFPLPPRYRRELRLAADVIKVLRRFPASLKCHSRVTRTSHSGHRPGCQTARRPRCRPAAP